MASKPNLSIKIPTGSSQDVEGTETAATLLASLRDDMQHNLHSLRTFIGTFQSLMKCEMGTRAFKAKLENMPLKDHIFRVGLFINTSQPRNPSDQETLAIEAICRRWCTPFLYLEVRQQLLELPYSKNALRGHTAATKQDLAAFLIDQLLIPILQDPALQ